VSTPFAVNFSGIFYKKQPTVGPVELSVGCYDRYPFTY